MNTPLPGLSLVTQPVLPGLAHARLTPRQAIALAIIREHGPITCTELGRRVREIRGVGHSDWDTSNGRALATALKRAKGGPLIRELRGQRFVEVGWLPPAPDGFNEFPEGF